MPCTLSSTCCFLLGVRVLGEDPRSAVVQVSTSNTIFKKIATPKVSHATAQFLRHEVHPLKLFPRCRARSAATVAKGEGVPTGAAAGRARHAAVLHCGAGSGGSGLEAPQRLPARRCAIRPLGNDHHDLKGIEDGEQGERSPRAGATRHPSPPFSAHQPSGQKRESRAFPPQNGVHPPRRASALLCPPCLPYIFPPQPKLPGCTGDNQGPHRQNCGGKVLPLGDRAGEPYKKDPLALKAARGSRTIFGSGLLSHMTLCSIIGDGELNFRVRNGVGCTLSSMATKEISGHLFESGCVARLRAPGHGRLCPLPALPAGAPCHIRTSAPKCGNTTEMPLSKY